MASVVRCPAHDKVMFKRKVEARRAADRMSDRDRYNVYRCTQTRAWHIGHSLPIREKKALKEIGGVYDDELADSSHLYA